MLLSGSSVSDTNDPGKLDLHSLLLKPELFYLQIMDDNWGHRPTATIQATVTVAYKELHEKSRKKHRSLPDFRPIVMVIHLFTPS